MKDILQTAAVLVGSLILFVPLTTVTVLVAVSSLWIVVTGDAFPNGPVFATALFVALLLGYGTAMEICCVRLHGFDQLHRGTRTRRLARHGMLGVVAFAAAVALSRILLGAISFGLANNDPAIFGLGVAGMLALSWVGVRSLTAFRAGTRRFRNGTSG